MVQRRPELPDSPQEPPAGAPVQDALPGLNGAAFEYHEIRQSSFPPPSEIQALHDIDPQYARDVFDMVKSNQQAQIDSQMVPIHAEAWALKIATFGVTFLPWMLLVAAIVFVLFGFDVAAWITGAVGLLGGGAQVIHATRRPRASAPRVQAEDKKK